MIPVTVIVTTRNEEANIEKCLRSVHGCADQIFVIDSESTDGTVEIARRWADDTVNLAYVHEAIIPWIFQWGLDHLPIRNDWVLLLEADQAISPGLARELEELFSRPESLADGYYIRRRQMFRGRPIRFGGYGSKHLLKLFRRSHGQLDPREQDTRVYVDGRLARLRSLLIEDNRKEHEILFYLQKHLRYAEAFAREELERRRDRLRFKQEPRLLGSPDQRVLWMKSVYYRSPGYLRALAYFLYRYVLLLGFLDGKTGAVFHFLQAFWFRLVVDIRIEELAAAQETSGAPPPSRTAST